jgi:hypothetical protein
MAINNFIQTMKKFNLSPELPADIDKPIIDSRDIEKQLEIMEMELGINKEGE